ncbi:MAG: A/G-specific adenine glycosylase [Pseudomonadota bacterium]
MPEALPDIKTEAVRDVLAWYDRHRRSLPWRAEPGEISNPYRVWLSEIMLQQTTVAVVRGYYARFLERFPTVEALAAASLDDVFAVWAGLGYYARARNLHACARVIVEERGGAWPDTVEGLRALPGIGAYTAAAIGALCFGTPDVPLDANIERVVARLERVETPLPKAREPLRRLAQAYRAPERPGDIAQALMDIGATLCTPRNPVCALCPLEPHCAASAAGDMTRYPVKLPKKTVPERRGVAYIARRGDGALLMTRRPSEGLLGGLWMVPAWWEGEPGDGAPPLAADWQPAGEARHGFTHFKLVLDLQTTSTNAEAPAGLAWMEPDAIGRSTLLKRILDAAKPDPT